MDRQRLFSLIRKEVIQLLRDRRGLIFILGLPLLQLLLFAYAVHTTVYHIPLAVVDQSDDRKSREFVQALVNSQYFDVSLRLRSQAEAIDAIDRGLVRAGIVIPPRFASITDRRTADVVMLLDGTDSVSVSSAYGAAALIAQQYSLQLAQEQLYRKGLPVSAGGMAAALPITASLRVLYNPDMIDVWFLIPGLIALIVQTLAVQQATLLVVREREMGTIEQLLATPTRPIELILSKMIPLLVLCFVATITVLAIGVFWFGVPFRGSLILFFLLALLFIVASLGLGLLISNRSQTQRQASQIALMTSMLGLLLSGMVYPQLSMPLIPRLIAAILPMTYFLRLSRGIMTKGVGLTYIWPDALALVFYSLIIILFAAKNFKKRLD